MVSEQLVNDSISFSTLIRQTLSDALKLAQHCKTHNYHRPKSKNEAKDYLTAQSTASMINSLSKINLIKVGHFLCLTGADWLGCTLPSLSRSAVSAVLIAASLI